MRLATAVPGRPGDGHRLLPVALRAGGFAELLPSCGSAMLRGLADRSGLALVGSDGAARGEAVSYLTLPWPSPNCAQAQPAEIVTT